MIRIILKDSIREYESGITVAEVAKPLGAGLYKAACAGRVDSRVVDLRAPLSRGCLVEILTFEQEEGKQAYWHTTSHIIAQAMKRLFPEAKFAIGPSIECGFYYNFDLPRTLTPEDLPEIEAEMKKIIKENLPIERFLFSPAETKKLIEEQEQLYKVELIEKHAGKGEDISFYRQGEFADLCAGPHLLSADGIKAVKLTAATSTYWRDDSKNKALQRVYGISFPKASELEEHLAKMEEARKRDHNVPGRQLEYFITVDYIGQDLPIMLPKGARILQTLQRFVEDIEKKRGYLLTKTPLMAESDLYEISDHWDHYRGGMFVMGGGSKGKEVFTLRPMTCPFQYQVFLNRQRSYRDLPMRLGETSTLFRNEDSGEMHGLIHVCQFTISESHLICAPEQLEDEFRGCVELANFMLRTPGLDEDVNYRFSRWDPNDRVKCIDTPEQWGEAQGVMERILSHLGLNYSIGVGEAAFYGPKLDIQIYNVHGKEDTLIIIQIDQMLVEKPGMESADKDGARKNPYIIHCTSLGCYERTLALLTEKYAGALPMWLMPEQVCVLPISERLHDQADEIKSQLEEARLEVTYDHRSEKIGYKIHEVQLEKIPYMFVIGDKEVENGVVAVRSHRDGDIGTMPLSDFIAKAVEKVRTKAK